MNIKDLTTGLIYRNPKPYLRSIHAYFPSVITMDNGEMLATFALGEAFEAVNSRTHVARSKDQGETWQLEGPIYPGTSDRLTSDYCRITSIAGGDLVAFMVRSDRTDHPEEGLANPENIGFVPTDCLLLRSSDYGRTWCQPQPITPPLVGPSFEICAPVTLLKDGRWIIPTSTWRDWKGFYPNGKRMVAFVSHDQGASWPEYLDVMHDPSDDVYFWESKIVEMTDSCLIAVAWAYKETEARDLPNQYAISEDGGRIWSAPQSTVLSGQTLTPFLLDHDQLLCVYRRIDKQGLWANFSHLEKKSWVNDSCEPLWGHQAQGLTGTNQNMVQNFNVLRFGAPCITRLADGAIFVAFWCYEDCVSNIRWFKFFVSGQTVKEKEMWR